MTDLEEHEQHAQRAREAREALVGKTIASRYVLRGLLGHGGMGAVYEAEHLGLGKRVAIKFVDPEFATDEKVVARFAREARVMSAMESAHIVTVFDAGTEDGRPYLVMELLRGEDLGQRLRRTRRVALAEAMHIVAQVLKGLARAHAAGIIHRDLKPDNVFLLKHDTDPLFAKIVDFGISKIERPRANTSPLALTGRGTVLGTPFYMSPEQAQAAPDVDGRADLYSVGAILFECLTGRPPHTGESYEQIILSICMREAPSVQVYDPALPAEVAAFVARSLLRDRAQRFTSAERMLAALHEVAPLERTRVPLDPPSPETLLSSAARVPDGTVLDGGAARGSRPSGEVSNVTRLGVASLGTAATEPAHTPPPEPPRTTEPEPEPRREKVTRPEGPKRNALRAVSPAGARIAASTPPLPKPARSSAPPAPKPIGAAIATAAAATLLGVGVTFGTITMLDKKTPEAAAPATSSRAANRATPSSAETNVATPPSASAAPSAVPSAAPSATASGKAAVPSARPTGVVPVPRPSARPLDIQRDLP